ncbi:hypothetical protein ASD35_06860 [Pelomonas sp. Root1444]|nr:hypothetical protein ASD35_06860 [Pelomonas sp. Root1444]
MQHWLQVHSGEQLPEAVFGGNDAIAFGCIEALRMRGVRVPEEVSVVGYDNSWMARSVQMATVHQPLHEMGRRAVEVLVQRIEARNRGDETVPSHVVLPTEVVLGKTLASPRRARLTIA